MTRSITYQNTCLACKEQGREANYWGETSLCCYKRAKVHLNEGRRRLEGSHVWLHILAYHRDDDIGLESSFKLSVVSTHRTAFPRQLNEVIIMNNAKGIIMNWKREYKSCIIPQLTAGGSQKHPKIQVQTNCKENSKKQRK